MKKKLSNNKGFSLVELIIVIAIMAVLIGVLAPQYLKYVEKSKVSADLDTIDGIVKATETAISDPDSKITSDFTFTIAPTGVTGLTPNSAEETEISAITDLTNVTLKSKTYASATVTVKVAFASDPNNSNIMVPTITVTDSTNNYKR